jgi:hypothetical protein
VSDWLAETTRITVFPQEPLNISQSFAQWWEKVVGTAPETENRQPRAGVVDVIGPFQQGILTLHVEPIRTDWVWTAIPDESAVSGSDVWNLGHADASSQTFTKLVANWCDSAFDASRAAFGLVAAQPAKSRETGYATVERQLKGWVHLDPERTYDFSYQVNWPSMSRVLDGHRINRLMRWSVSRQHKFSAHLLLEPGQQPSPRAASITDSGYYVRQDLDINTHSEPRRTLPRDTLFPVIEELREEAMTLLKEGIQPYANA